MTDVRDNIVAWAKWCATNHANFTYSEGPNRMSGIGHPGKMPVTADCSAFVTLCYNWAGAPDPNAQLQPHRLHRHTAGTRNQDCPQRCSSRRRNRLWPRNRMAHSTCRRRVWCKCKKPPHGVPWTGRRSELLPRQSGWSFATDLPTL